jgi:GNAT superfamily N-acetyltransferase
VSVAVAVAGVAGVVVSGWALQAAALAPPKPAAEVAADASVWFHEYRLAADVFHFDHRKIRGTCVSTWVRRRGEGKVRASLLSFQSGPIVRVSGKRQVSVLVARRRFGFPPALLAADAGCSRRLSHALTAAAQAGHVTAERSYAANRPAIALEERLGRSERLTIFVSPRTDRPLVAFVDLDRRDITARIYLQRVTRRVLARAGLLHEIKARPKR